jgi:hypothetical protein
MYNNTMVNGGFRQTKTGRGGAIDYEKSARGSIYNNLIVNCRFGVRITSDADVSNITYNNQYFYGYSPAIVAQFYSVDGVGVKQSGDILSVTPQQNDPLFYGYSVTQYDFTANPGPISAKLQPYNEIAIANGNFKLQSTSPGINKAKNDFSPMRAVTSTGIYGTTITPPGKDIGAYQNDGSGNQH